MIELRLIGTSYNCNGSMHLQIFDNGIKCYSNNQFQAGPIDICCNINWPTTVTIELSNRHHSDFVVDQHGSVISNKAIEIDTMSVNQFPIQYELLEPLFHCQRKDLNAVTHENFWAFNGTVTINFDAASPMHYMLNLKNAFLISR